MKVLMLGSGSYKGSLSLRLMAFARHMKKFGWDPTIVLPSADKYNDFTADKKAKLRYAKLIQPWQPTSKIATVNLLPYIFSSAVCILRTKTDAIYLYKPTPINVVGLLPKLLRRIPLILDLDDLGSEVMKSEGRSKLQYKLVEFCEQITMKHASAIVVASSFLESIVKEKYPSKTVFVVPNGVEPSDYSEHSAKRLRNGIYYFGAINRLSLVEDFLRALPKVINSVPDTIITIAGGGAALDEAKSLANELGISKNIRFTGWIDMTEIQKYVNFGDIAICYQPDTRTVRAASNMKVFQYMAMASVPVVSEVGDLSQYLNGEQAGVVVPPNNPEVLANSLVDLLLNRDDRLKKALAARKLAKDQYSWESRSRLLGDALKSLLRVKSFSLWQKKVLPKLEDYQLPFLSVVVCSYNGARLIGRTISSIQAQNYPKDRFEIIVVDDGSTDNTVAISESFAGVRVIRQPHNMGISAARNAGLREARGDIYVCSDDDCFYTEDWLRQIARGYALDNVVGVGGYLAEMQGLKGVLNHYFSVLGSGFPPIIERRLQNTASPIKRGFRYIVTSLHRLDIRTDDYVEVIELYGANASFPMGVLRSVGGWSEDMDRIEDRDISKRILDKFSGMSFYAVRNAEVVHDPGIPLKKFLMRQYFRATDTYDFCRVNNIFPPLYPFPILLLLILLYVGIMINVFYAPFILLLGPQVLYFWWPYFSLKFAKPVYFAFPYLQIAEETMETAGIIRAYLRKRLRSKHAYSQ